MSDLSTDEHHILIIEDDAHAASIAARGVLSAFDQIGVSCCCHEAASMQEGLERLKAQHMDAIVLDLMLPDCSGLNCVYMLKKHYPRTPVVITSNMTDLDMAMDALRLGAQDFLLKEACLHPTFIGRAILFSLERSKHNYAVEFDQSLEALHQMIYSRADSEMLHAEGSPPGV